MTKPDGSLCKPDVRPCIDYRKENQVTRADAFPIPRLEDSIGRIGQAEVVSKLDLLKSYWQVPLSSQARCNVLPFGMNGKTTVDDSVMAGLSTVIMYIDDMVVHSATRACCTSASAV